jgi:hypothetical protein
MGIWMNLATHDAKISQTLSDLATKNEDINGSLISTLDSKDLGCFIVQIPFQ